MPGVGPEDNQRIVASHEGLARLLLQLGFGGGLLRPEAIPSSGASSRLQDLALDFGDFQSSDCPLAAWTIFLGHNLRRLAREGQYGHQSCRRY